MKIITVLLISTLFFISSCRLVLADTKDVPTFLYENLRADNAYNKTHQQTDVEIIKILSDSGDEQINRLIEHGEYYTELKDYVFAELIFRLITVDKPTFSDGHNKLAFVYYKLEEYKKAKESVDSAISLNPLHYRALAGKGLIEDKLKNYRASLLAFKKAIKIYPKLKTEIMDKKILELKKKIKLSST